MGSTWESVQGTYNYLFDELSDPTTKGWFLASSPFPLLAILVSYNIFCTKIGPRLMKNRKPFDLKRVIQLYNIFQVLISLYITYEGCVYTFSGNFNFKCQGVDRGNKRVARGVQTYFMTKLVELLDTIFFVLRKSDRQVTFLHLYHHTLMPIVSWIGLKYLPGGQGTLIGTVNSFIHVVMYTYYLLSGLGPEYQKYLWWKKYLTVMQIVQFTIILIHSVNSLFYSCDYHIVLKLLTILEACTFIYMFSKFYYYSYIVKGKKSSNGVSNGKDSNGKAVSNGHGNEDSKDVIKNEDCIKNTTNGHSRINGFVYSSQKDKKL